MCVKSAIIQHISVWPPQNTRAKTLWADDVVLIAGNEHNLNQMFRIVETYCDENELTINVDKTKYLTGRLLRTKFYLYNKELEGVGSDKHFRFSFTSSG